MKKALIGSIIIVSIGFSSNNMKDKIVEPATKLEKIRDVKGTILLKAYQDIGSMYGKYGSKLSITVYEFDNKKAKTKTHGLNVEIESSDKYNKRVSSFIDYEEISSLLKGLDYISKINKNPTKLKHYEAIYKTNGGMKVTNFNSSQGNLVAVEVGRYSAKSVYFETNQLNELMKIITNSLNEIKKLK